MTAGNKDFTSSSSYSLMCTYKCFCISPVYPDADESVHSCCEIEPTSCLVGVLSFFFWQVLHFDG